GLAVALEHLGPDAGAADRLERLPVALELGLKLGRVARPARSTKSNGNAPSRWITARPRVDNAEPVARVPPFIKDPRDNRSRRDGDASNTRLGGGRGAADRRRSGLGGGLCGREASAVPRE